MESDTRRNKRKVESFFDFINVELYTNPKRYSVKDMDYYIYSEKKQEFQKYHVTDALTWEDLKPYFDEGILFVS